MSRLIIVRHCESEANRGGPETGASNSPLSARGRAQALALRDVFAQLGLTEPALISSPLLRAVDTAAAISDALGVAPTLDDRLSAGETIGARLDLRDPATRMRIGGDVLAVLNEQFRANPGVLIAVSHRYPIWALMTRLFGEPGREIVGRLGNGDRLELTMVDGAVQGDLTHHRLEG